MTEQTKTIQPVARQHFTELERMALVQECLRCHSSISLTEDSNPTDKPKKEGEAKPRKPKSSIFALTKQGTVYAFSTHPKKL